MNDVFEISTTDQCLVSHADWVEVSCLFSNDNSTSVEDLGRAIHQSTDFSEEKSRELANDAFAEIADRIKDCGRVRELAYPFNLSERGDVLYLSPFAGAALSAVPYLFQLMITRWDMSSTTRTLCSIDPTKVFERLCAEVLRSYWGDHNGQSGAFVFGTSAGVELGNFPEKLNHLINTIHEGGGYKVGVHAPGAGDAKLDIVSYKSFEDKRNGSLVGFAQCKTGKNWRTHLSRLNTKAFCAKYMLKQPVLDPVRIYMIPERIHYAYWEGYSHDGGLLFDRCRITQFAGQVSDEVLTEARSWFNEAIARTKKPS